jgi:hypothetical protein
VLSFYNLHIVAVRHDIGRCMSLLLQFIYHFIFQAYLERWFFNSLESA